MLSRFFSYYRPHRRLFVLDFSCAVVSGLLELAFPLACRSLDPTAEEHLSTHIRELAAPLVQTALGLS